LATSGLEGTRFGELGLNGLDEPDESIGDLPLDNKKKLEKALCK
jgi:hypothetical protein